MNTDPKTKRILCYGDSNTWGAVPVIHQRYPADVRWTGLLQKRLGKEYEVIEEGLNIRTTRWEYSLKERRNGLAYLGPCVETHSPVDIVILFLGTNDLKKEFNQTAESIAQSIRVLVQEIKNKAFNKVGMPPVIILVSPAVVDESVPSTQEKYHGAEAKSLGLGETYKKVSVEAGCEFIDSARVVKSSKKDGIHFEAEAHQKIAEEMKKVVLGLE